ncbi:class I SAM-dependent methyltransferase [Desulfovibrio inopinatus]|uniref:class I SAM-dependent methyltransferase n=1 Tax=Desulfovibrio inopinatus TaxID=102109 RepID=UPI0003FC310B|nr:class I SAM-dependent methyltransferase [Desulfovibrio inopinatus]
MYSLNTPQVDYDAAALSKELVSFYDSYLKVYGDTALGAAWPSETDRTLRFRIGCELILQFSGGNDVTVCDLGCGTGEFYSYILQESIPGISYIGVDASDKALRYARQKFSDVRFLHLDPLNCLENELKSINCDFVFANGLFTVKNTANYAIMWMFMTTILEKIWPRVRRGIIFNVMSKIVDWERDDLFHVSYDELARYLHGLAGRFIGFRADYGLYEFMAYAIKPEASTLLMSHSSSS